MSYQDLCPTISQFVDESTATAFLESSPAPPAAPTPVLTEPKVKACLRLLYWSRHAPYVPPAKQQFVKSLGQIAALCGLTRQQVRTLDAELSALIVSLAPPPAGP